MSLRKKLIFKVPLFMLTSSFLFGKGFWVNYGWEIFDYVTSAHVASLGNSTIAYPLETVSGSIINPFIISKNIKKIELSHQSRFAGLVSSDIISGQLDINQRTLFNYNILYEGIGSIPDTRGALMDWGFDGVYGTNDVGENNGKLDEGERLDDSKINYFSQRQIAFHSAFLREINQKKIGIGVKLLHYRLDKNYALGFGLDLGTMYKVKKIDLAFVLRNFPSSGLMWDNGTIEGSTPIFSFGIHLPYEYKKYPIKTHFLISLDVNTNKRNLDSQLMFGRLNLESSIGYEIKLKERISLRFGRNKLNVITGGLGIRWNEIGIDYAFLASDLGAGFGNHHLFTVSISTEILADYLKRLRNN